jgi:hypothetical protein
MSLIWNPLLDAIQRCTDDGTKMTACISAFATVEAVEEILRVSDPLEFHFITRWRTSELAMGVADLAVYERLRGEGVPLYINYRLHSKVYRFSDGTLICGSGNATNPGLGLSEIHNIETAALVSGTTLQDELEFKKLRDSSLRVDDEIYNAFYESVSNCPLQPPIQKGDAEMYEPYREDDLFLLSDLPATKHPSDLIREIRACDRISELPEQMVIDCVTFGVKEGMSPETAIEQLSVGFQSSPFVRVVLEEIREEGSLSFGAMSSFIHDYCRDVPASYRSEVKETVNTLYNWLCFFFDDLSWDVPGARSQVIRTNRRR